MNEKETYLDLMETSIEGMMPSERHSTMQSFQMNALYAQVFALASIAESLARIAAGLYSPGGISIGDNMDSLTQSVAEIVPAN